MIKMVSLMSYVLYHSKNTYLELGVGGGVGVAFREAQ